MATFEPNHSQLRRHDITSAPPAKLDEPVLTMNAAFATDGVHLKIAGTIDTPVELVFLATDGEPRTIATRNVIEIEGCLCDPDRNPSGRRLLSHQQRHRDRLGEGARLDRVKVELEAARPSIWPMPIHPRHERRLARLHADLGRRVNRQNGTVLLRRRGTDAKIAGAYLLAGRQHADTRLVVDHRVPQCTSREVFKCVMDDHARGIFQGKVIVQRDAQKTDGKQSSHALLLSETAEFDAKPELEIFADDVVCGHGATSGDIDHDQLFYLRSRGIPRG